MGEALEQSALERWRNDPAEFITEVLRDPETGKPFILLDAEKEFLKCAYALDADGRLLYPDNGVRSAKEIRQDRIRGDARAYHGAYLRRPFAEGYVIANDLEQSQGRVFQAVRRIVEKSPLLLREARVTQYRIEFPATGAAITAIASDYAGAAGANPTISCFDELWGYTSERITTAMGRNGAVAHAQDFLRFTTTYAGFEGESSLLEELHNGDARCPS